LARLRIHIQAHGWELRDEDIFRDDGYSGATLNRPGLDRLRDAVRAAGVDRVLVTDPDRLARNYVHQRVLLEERERFGCQVEFLDRPMSQDLHDQLLLQIRGAVAEYERTLIAERMRRGRQMKLRAGGLLPWTRAPYGYRVNPDRPRDPAGVRVAPAEAAVVQELFAHYLEERASLFGPSLPPVLRYLSRLSKASANPGVDFALWQVALESGHDSRYLDPSRLYGPGLCGPYPVTRTPPAAFGDASDRQALDDGHGPAAGAVGPARHPPGPRQSRAV